MEPFNIIKAIAEAGGIGLAGFAIWVIYKMTCNNNTVATNHLVHIVEALSGISAKLDRVISNTEKDN